MTERLSKSTIGGNVGLLIGCLVASSLWLFLAIQQAAPWLNISLSLLLIAATAYQCLFSQLTLQSSTVRVSRLFGLTASYHVTDFVAIRQTPLPYQPLRISFTDGQSFLFLPKIKESPFSLHYTPAIEFIAHWSKEIAERAALDA